MFLLAKWNRVTASQIHPNCRRRKKKSAKLISHTPQHILQLDYVTPMSWLISPFPQMSRTFPCWWSSPRTAWIFSLLVGTWRPWRQEEWSRAPLLWFYYEMCLCNTGQTSGVLKTEYRSTVAHRTQTTEEGPVEAGKENRSFNSNIFSSLMTSSTQYCSSRGTGHII